MNNYDEFIKTTKLLLFTGEGIDWSILEKTAFKAIFTRMSKTHQNLAYHAEDDVLTHTKMVCEEIIKLPEYINGSETDKIILFWAALLHDIGKTICTVFEDGELKSPHHSSKGAILARELLWTDFGLCGSIEKQQIRESICCLIRYHSFPPYALSYENADYRFLKIASNGELAKYFSLEKLCALERADVLGRIGPDGKEALERIEWCRDFADELGCLKEPYKFANDFSKRAFFKGKTTWKDQDLFNDSFGEVILMGGLPGTGKDTYINENFSNLPMISLDKIRKELGISPTENQGRVISVSHERAKELLRKKQSFVWNATNITELTRGKQISLFENYGASVKTIFLETDWKEQNIRNKSRKAEVPSSAIYKMLSKLTLPERYESERVVWEIV